MPKAFDELTEREILALAISLEEEDGRIYLDFAAALAARYPATAEVLRGMAAEESEHRRQLFETYRERFGEHVPLIRRQDVRGFVSRRPAWLIRSLGLETVRKQAELMELETRRFYERAAARTTDAGMRKLLGDLAEVERGHSARAAELEAEILPPDVRREMDTPLVRAALQVMVSGMLVFLAGMRKLLGDLAEVERGHSARAAELEAEILPPDVRREEEATRRRLFVLQVVQPGLAGLMDGSVSTLAPLFAAAFATHDTWDSFVVGMAASVGAGISMGFAEALSDDGSLTGRGRPLLRGLVCGLMTTLGGIGHTLPFLIPSFRLATKIALAVVAKELTAISWIRHRFMDTPLLRAAVQVMVGGVLVFLAGMLIGSS